jgi:ENTH domain
VRFIAQQAVLEFRLGYPPDKWRNVYKALTVLEFLLKRGAPHIMMFTRRVWKDAGL